ncbi:formate dehydrogenase-N subunit beta [Salmonella enterica subsp. enterica serovar Heidelberg str. 79-0480]|nr:formate dehydrogenase-N subunit beta [Salmonella enterica subsp. enterica serovar Heidelberg str. 79-0480]
MYALRRSRQRGPGTGLRQNLSDRGYSLRHQKEMLELGEQRVEKLKARGFEHAGIYNPQGVGGTHVMYVLHHANQPELYHGLPKDPQIDTSINLWKGALKPLAAAGFIATFAGLIYHYIGIGPNKETDDDEEDHHE